MQQLFYNSNNNNNLFHDTQRKKRMFYIHNDIYTNSNNIHEFKLAIRLDIVSKDIHNHLYSLMKKNSGKCLFNIYNE